MVTTYADREIDIKKEAFLKRLEDFLAEQGAFGVLWQPYGKPATGLRYTIVRKDAKKGENPQVLTGTYEEKDFQKRTARELVSGPVGRLKQILGDAVNEDNRGGKSRST